MSYIITITNSDFFPVKDDIEAKDKAEAAKIINDLAQEAKAHNSQPMPYMFQMTQAILTKAEGELTLQAYYDISTGKATLYDLKRFDTEYER